MSKVRQRLDRFRRFQRREDGQALVVIVLAMLLMIALALVLVDGGHAFVEKRSLQNAAEAASLAAAAQLTPGMPCTGVCLVNVKNTAEQYLDYNGVTDTLVRCSTTLPMSDSSNPPNCYQTPYIDSQGNSHDDEVGIKVTRTVSTFFGGPVGVGSIDISARAASRATPVTAATTTPGVTQADQTVYNTDTSTNVDNGTTNYSTTTTASTIAGTTTPDTTVYSTSTNVTTLTTSGPGTGVAFAMSQACPAISYNGAGGNKIGALETNGGVDIQSNGLIVDSLGWGKRGTSGCDPQKGTINTSYGPFSPKGWPLPPPNPAPPAGCTPLVLAGTTFSYTVNSAALTSTVTTKAVASGAATLTTSAAHNLKVGDTVSVSIGALGFDGPFTVTGVPTSTTFSYAAPSFATTAWSVDASGNTATLTTASAHGLNVGDSVNVSGFPTTGKIDLGFLNRGPVTVTAATTTSPHTFSYTLTDTSHGNANGTQNGNVVIVNANSSSASGTATVTAVNPTASGTVTDIGPASTYTVTGKALTGTTATLTTSTSNTISVGDTVTVSIGDPRFDGTYTVTAAPNSIATGWTSTHGPGIYCLTGGSATLLTISANGTNFTGYTFFAPNITVNSNGQTFSPATGETTVFDAYTGDLTLNGNTNTASGNMFAPNGAATISGGGVGAGSGFIEAQTLSITGNFSSFTGTGGFGGTTSTSTSTTTTPSTIQGTTQASSTVTSVSTSTSTVNGTTSTTYSTTPITIVGTTTPGTTNTSTTDTTVGLGE